MGIVDYIRSTACCSFDPIGLAGPEQLRMIFIASAVVSVVAAFFAAYLSHYLTALPFIFCGAASYLCSYLVERYFLYEQALSGHEQAERELTAALRAAEAGRERSEQTVEERERQNGALQGQIDWLQLTAARVAEATQVFRENLQEENRQQGAQNRELRARVQELADQNARFEQLGREFRAQIGEGERANERLRLENGQMVQRLREQQQINEVTHREVERAGAVLAEARRRGEEAFGPVERIRDAARETVDLQQRAEEQGAELLRLRALVEDIT